MRNTDRAERTALQIAIFNSGRKQVAIALDAQIHPTRLSKLANGWDEPTDDEVDALERVLQTPRRKLFPKSKAVA